MKKLLLFSISLVAVTLSFISPETAIAGGILTLSGLVVSPLGNKDVLERMAIQNFDNYDAEFDNWQANSSDEPGIFTINITNNEAAARRFYLFNGSLILAQNVGFQIIPALNLDGAPGVATQTQAQLIYNAPIGQIVDGTTRAIGKTVADPPYIHASASISTIQAWLTYALSSRKTQVITGIKIDSGTAANHTGNITVGKINPYKDMGSRNVNLSSFRSPKDFQSGVTVVPLGVALKADVYISMDIAASSTMTLTLFMNGHSLV